MAAGQSASLLVNGTDLMPVVFNAADIQIPFRADDIGVFAGFSLADVSELLVIVDMPVPDRPDYLRVAAEGAADHRHQRVGFFNIIGRAGEDDKITLIALFFHEPQRNRIRYSSVQKLIAADLDDAGDKRHGA